MKILFCVMLLLLALGAVFGTQAFLESRMPWVDFSSRETTTAPRPGAASAPATDDRRLRFAVATMVSPEATFSTYRQLVRRISRKVGRDTDFVMRPSYAEVREKLEKGEVDVAFVCTGTYVHSLRGKRIKLLVQPEFAGGRQYQCLLIVPARSSSRTMDDLRGKVMAFTDPESNTGCLVPTMAFRDLGHDPPSFFKRIIFTGSHDRSILSVAAGVVDCAAVDSLVWDSLVQDRPSLAAKVRVIWRSEAFGPPPIVVPSSLRKDLEDALRETFLSLHKDEEGRAILSAIGIDRFVLAKPESYETAVELYRRYRGQGDSRWP